MLKIALKFQWIVAVAFYAVTSTSFSEEVPPFSTDVKSGPTPWTHTKFIGTDNDFHFAIVSDRQGGARKGVFESAIQKLNLLRPAFVMSTGNYISGYESDPNSLRKQWAQFDGMLKNLEAPFFYIPGSHDYANWMKTGINRRFDTQADCQALYDATGKVWKELRGPTYYSFKYKNTLFLCLNAMGGENHRWGLGNEQYAWAKDVLAQNKDVRWTFIFVHSPFWMYEKRGESTDKSYLFPEFEKALTGRKYTVFAGHWHKYVYSKRNEMKYFILSGTGGWSDLAGPQWGSFDGIMSVSMSDAGPKFTNRTLNDEVVPEDIYTDATLKFEESIRLTTQKSVREEKMSVLEFACTNFFSGPLKVDVKWRETPQMSLETGQKSMTIAPGQAGSVSLQAHYQGASWPVMPAVECNFNAGTQFAASRVFTPPHDFLDSMWLRPSVTIFRAKQPLVVDGKLDEPHWQQAPTVLDYWKPDASVKADPNTQTWFAYDDENLYVVWRCEENNMKGMVAYYTVRDDRAFRDDSIELLIKPSAEADAYYEFAINSKGVLFDAISGGDREFNANVKIGVACNKSDWVVEVAIPWKDLKVSAPKSGDKMSFGLSRNRPQKGVRDPLSQFPPLGYVNNHQPKRFGELIFK